MAKKEQNNNNPLNSMKNSHQKVVDIHQMKFREGRNMVQSLIKLKSISKNRGK